MNLHENSAEPLLFSFLGSGLFSRSQAPAWERNVFFSFPGSGLFSRSQAPAWERNVLPALFSSQAPAWERNVLPALPAHCVALKTPQSIGREE